jgi:hypothetical protein
MRTRQAVPIILALFLLAGCATVQRTMEELRPSEKEGYLLAIQTLNNFWEEYLDHRDTLSGAVRQEWKDKFKDTGESSYFTQASVLLNAWNVALINGDKTTANEKCRAVWDVIDTVIAILNQEGVL